MYLEVGVGGMRVSARRVKLGGGGGAAVNRSHRPGQEKSTFCVIEGNSVRFCGDLAKAAG